MTLVTPSEYVKLKRIQEAVKANFLPQEIPNASAVQGKLDQELLEAIAKQDPTSEAVELLARLESTMDVSQIACRLIALLQSGRKARGPQRIGLDADRLRRLSSRPRHQGGRGKPSSQGRFRSRAESGQKPWQKRDSGKSGPSRSHSGKSRRDKRS
jgi:hypothetical protein